MKRFDRQAQSTIEYLLLMTIIIIILISVINPFGKMTQLVNDSIEVATQGIECMAEKTCYPPDPCPPKYGDCTSPVLPSP